jgi:hypothetical protein
MDGMAICNLISKVIFLYLCHILSLNPGNDYTKARLWEVRTFGDIIKQRQNNELLNNYPGAIGYLYFLKNKGELNSYLNHK